MHTASTHTHPIYTHNNPANIVVQVKQFAFHSELPKTSTNCLMYTKSSVKQLFIKVDKILTPIKHEKLLSQ